MVKIRILLWDLSKGWLKKMEMVLARVRISTALSRLEIITPSSKQGVISKSLRRETLCQPSLSLQIAILDNNSQADGYTVFIPSPSWVAECWLSRLCWLTPLTHWYRTWRWLANQIHAGLVSLTAVNVYFCPDLFKSSNLQPILWILILVTSLKREPATTPAVFVSKCWKSWYQASFSWLGTPTFSE